MEEVDDVELVVERIAALDLGKAGLEACVRVPHPQRPGRRMQELRGYGTTTAQLLEMVGWLRHRAGAAGGDGVHQQLLEGGVLPAGGRRV
jgi:hypothetical protein